MEIQSIELIEQDFYQRLDKVILNHHENESRTSVQGWIKAGCVFVNDKNEKSSYKVQSLSKQLEEHTVIRRYIALVHGEIPHTKGRIVAPIGRDQRDRQKMNVTSHNGKEAITNFTVLERFKNMTLVECRLETGRTHQIRVHMNYIGYPVYGDPKYGYRNDDISHGQYLHAKLLGFKHPVTGKELLFECKLPDWFENKLNELRG